MNVREETGMDGMITARGGRTAAAYTAADLTEPMLIVYRGSAAVVEIAALLASGRTAVVLAPVPGTTPADVERAERLAHQGALLATELGIKAVPRGEAGTRPAWQVVGDVAEATSAWLVVAGPEAEPLVGHIERPLLVIPDHPA
ncbi:hypothetical protein ABZT06_48325 [Streptomyces sp. NPDC005483]|uniref:hypothetical protein n=1 Tax=Streptomyces sp. NPDC005483 TaxID=3154882 RepID=UPI0033A750F6